jgi:hypothetical protein
MPGTGLTSCVCSSGKLSQVIRGITIPRLALGNGLQLVAILLGAWGDCP